MRVAVSRFNHLIDFGTTETVPADTLEGSTEKFISQQTLHFAYYQRSQTQQFQLVGTKLQDTITIIVRSKYHVSDKTLAKIHGDDTTYKILTITRGEQHSPINYDLITLQDVSKIGDANG